ncbi:serine/threonine-protein kinase STY46-like [Typha angustifolia]|uniref:serine/threonine-protein kinase STY46-like n=1 Tax=Typha angustifolia TaxID=59011 RepID=UPI003C2F459F
MERSPITESKMQEHRSCCKGLAVIFSLLSGTKQSPPKSILQQQVVKLKEEVQRQRELKATYKARLEGTQEYLRHCLDIAQENGFLHQISNNQQHSSPVEVEDRTTVGNPHLANTRDQAKLNGWSIEPNEINLQEKIGQGTTAEIYRGTWRGLDVAVKWIYPNFFLSNENGEDFFAQELDTLSRQRHPYVVRLVGACLLPPENCFIVTELLNGRTLAEWLHGHKERLRERSTTTPLPPLLERIEKGLEIAQAMQYLHEQKPKVIHRDLKPSNVLLDDSMHVRVADFGHARFLLEGQEALTGETGTYVYMPPEVIRCEPYNEKCDVYSFGIILNELITGEHPYMETNYGPTKIALEVAEGRLRPKLPEDYFEHCKLIELICCLWDEDASRRPSFGMITSALRLILEKLT